MTDFDSLYQRYAPQVHRFALFLCGDASLADDITSETFVRAWTSLGKIREATVKSYLFTIARNLYRDHLRRNKRLTGLEDSIPDSSPGIQARAEHKAELAAVLAALHGLPEVDRAALLMRVQEEMPYEEIAHALELPVTTVKVKVHRARLKLMQLRSMNQEVRS
ncbi:MAG TPA: sigma-70 family RNA polymerase sigma factor [Candidatus Limnocylindrales bacterium]|nr:sigma-70 family RNA polymerase sigma factor [Candidatus Limnocylindrales bacterium]